MNSGHFFREFLSKPTLTGAVAPSSAFLAKAMMEGLELSKAEAVLEYGPGTGSFTTHIVKDLGQSAKFVAIEINPRIATIFKRQHPDIVLFQDSVANVRRICDSVGIGSVDCIVSGLPWAAFPERTQIEFLDATMSVLKHGGRFVTFAYVHGLLLPAAHRLAQLLPKYFRRISKSDVVWLNTPPAFVYRCTR